MKPCRIVSAFGLAASIGAATFSPAAARIATPGTAAFPNKVMLGCAIVSAKIVQITNSTTSPIAKGTKITYDAVRTGNGGHYGETLSSPLLPPGASFKRGGAESVSCSAWFVRPLLLAPN